MTQQPSFMRPRNARLALLVLACIQVLAGGCGGGEGPAGTTVSSIRTISLFGGGNQGATVGATLPVAIEVVALDASGQPATGADIAFEPVAGGGSVDPQHRVTDATGHARTTWTLGTRATDADSLKVSASSSASGGASPLYVLAVARAASAAALDVQAAGASGRAGELVSPAIAVMLRDAYGNRSRVAGIPVTVRVIAASQDTLGGVTSATTDADGVATFANMSAFGKSGPVALQFESAGLTAAQASVSLSAGVAARLDAVSSSPIQATPGAPTPALAARVVDRWSNPIDGVDVTFTIDRGSVLGHATTGADGVASLTAWTIPTVGTYSVTASAAGVQTPATLSVVARAGAGAAVKASSSNVTSGTVNTDLTLAISVEDAAGNRVSGAVVDWSVEAIGGQVTTNPAGDATIVARLPKQAGGHDLVARIGTSAPTTIKVQAAPDFVASVTPTADSVDLAAGASTTLSFIARDQFGNAVQGSTINGSLANSRLLRIATTSEITDANGMVRFTVTAGSVAEPGFVIAYFGAPASPPALVPLGKTIVYTIAALGTLRADLPGCSVSSASGSTSVSAFVYGPNARSLPGVAVAFNVSAGNGTVFGDDNAQAASRLAITTSKGVATMGWLLQGTSFGSHALTVSTPSGYAFSPTVISCTFTP